MSTWHENLAGAAQFLGASPHRVRGGLLAVAAAVATSGSADAGAEQPEPQQPGSQQTESRQAESQQAESQQAESQQAESQQPGQSEPAQQTRGIRVLRQSEASQQPQQSQQPEPSQQQQPQQSQQPEPSQRQQPQQLQQAEQSQQAQQPQQPQQQQAAGQDDGCGALPGHEELTQALREVVTPGDPSGNGGLGNHMWAVAVDRSGTICAVARSGEGPGDQWPGSRAIAASKAFTANAFSLPGFALSTANLYFPVQPGGSLFGLRDANPANPLPIYSGSFSSWGGQEDPLVGRRVGGTVVFAGGLALYSAEGDLLGAVGVSGDESCTDHIVAWKVRDQLDMDNVPDGVAPGGHDNIIHDLTTDPATGKDKSASGYGHPACSPAARRIAQQLPEQAPTGPGGS